MTTKIAINGACGRMGLTVGRLALENASFKISDALESAVSPALGKDYGHYLGGGTLGVVVSSTLSGESDALIDFSTPAASIARLDECAKGHVPAVICTTGFDEAQKKKIASLSKTLPIVLSSNMSVGVNLLFRYAAEIAAALGADYDIDIVETHHRFKKDAPSGTAKTLAEEITRATGRKVNIAAVRSGDVVGEHRVIFGSLGDMIELTHRASSRDIFAKGALRAATWVSQAKSGLYSMKDVLTP